MLCSPFGAGQTVRRGEHAMAGRRHRGTPPHPHELL